MRKSAIATSLILTGAIAVFAADMTKTGHLELTSIQDVQKLIPNAVPPQFAKVLEGNDKDCLTKTSQTKPLTRNQITTLRQLTSRKQVEDLLGNAHCQTAIGFKYVLESKKELTVRFGEILDYDLSTPSTSSLTNRNRAADRIMLSRPPEKGVASKKEAGKVR